MFARGLSEAELHYDRTKKLLTLLRSLTDSECLMLRYYGLHSAVNNDHRSAMLLLHPDVLRPVSGEIGLPAAEADRGAFRAAFEQTLVSSGLLNVTEKLKRPTALGMLLLRYTEEIEARDSSEPA